MKNDITKKIIIILYDVITAVISMTLATVIISSDKTDTMNYMYYLPYYILGLTFLQIAIYFVFGIYRINLNKMELNDLALIAISTGVILGCNIIFVLISGWFTILWAFLYAFIMLAFTCGLRFIFTVLTIKKQESGEANNNASLETLDHQDNN